jgi:hypothetical protein
MRIPEHELNQVPFDLDFLVGHVGGGEGVMRVRRRARYDDAGEQADEQSAVHGTLLSSHNRSRPGTRSASEIFPAAIVGSAQSLRPTGSV